MPFIGQYEVLSDLGAGGMGTVVLAKSSAGNLVVIKQPLAGDELLRDLLIDEARLGLRLKHPHIVDTLDFFELEGQVSLVLSYVSGASLADLRDHGPLPPGVVCRVGQHAAEALDAIHHATDEQGRLLHVVHRDVTPGNIMVGHDGSARLIDLGIAKSDDRITEKTRTGMLRGTLRYLAPEVFEDGVYSPASDVWALAVSLLDAALGRPAIDGKDPEVFAKVMSMRIFELLPGEALDPRLEKALRRALQKRPGKRPSAKELAAMLGMLAKELGGTEEKTRGCVIEAVGGPSPDNADTDATEMLVERVQATYHGNGSWAPPPEPTARDVTPGGTLRPPPEVSGPISQDALKGAETLQDYLSGLRSLEAAPPTAPTVRRPVTPTPSGGTSAARGVSMPLVALTGGGVLLALGLGILVAKLTSSDDGTPADAGPTAVVVALADAGRAPAEPPKEPPKRDENDDDNDDDKNAGKDEPREERDPLAGRGDRKADELERLRKKMPSCWRPGVTRYFYYTTRRGSVVAKKRFQDIPRRWRRRVKCAN